MRLCRACSQSKADNAFYASNLTRCKECVKIQVHTYRTANIERIREHDRQRGLLPHRKAKVKDLAHRYRDRPYYKNSHKREMEHWPEKRRARVAVSNAIRNGRLIPQPCERCATKTRVEAHHEDYSRTFDVIWLCPEHHGERHRELNEEQRQASRQGVRT